MIPVKQSGLLRHGTGERLAQQRRQHLPEPVLRMVVKEHPLPGLDRGKGPENQHPGVPVIERRDGVGHIGHGITSF